MKISEQYYSLKNNIVFCLAVPLFIMLFMVIYHPTFFGEADSFSQAWELHDSLFLPIICAIVLVVLAISRAILCFALVRHSLTRRDFLLWQCIEIVVTSLFTNLFLSLYLQCKYLSLLPRVLLISFRLVAIPYLLYWVITEMTDRDFRLHQAESLIEELRKGIERNESGMVRFADEKGNVKLVVSADRVICLESAGNYVTITYDDDGKLVRYSLRNTLKAIEDLCNANGLVRCHRSFFVNLGQIRTLRRTPQGIYAEIGHPGVDDIPVSKTYASELIRLFGN
jgi:hypothetical protein